MAVLAGLGAGERRQIEVLARVNAEQAEAAFRRVFVFNLMLPSGLPLGLFQLETPWTMAFLRDFDLACWRLIAAAAIVLLLLATVYFAFLRSKDARDSTDLVALAKAHAERLDEAA